AMLANMAGADWAIEQLRLLPAGDVVKLLVKRREDQWFERKSARTRPHQLADSMIAFANAEGGLIVVGLHDGRVEGITVAGGLINGWRQAALDFSQPPVRHRFEIISYVNEGGEEDELALIEVESSERVHTNVRGETLLRVGDESRRLRPREAQELRYDKGESAFDGTVVRRASIADLDSRVLSRYLSRVRATDDAEAALRARGLAALDGRTTRPTNAGLLVLGIDPQQEFPEGYLRLIRYHGAARETGARSNVQTDRRLAGSLPAQIDAARRLLRRWLPATIRLRSQGLFASSTLIPQPVWLEAVVNAATHRSYSIGGDHIRIEVFQDRLEVESPGRLPGLVRLENIRSTRFARNPRVARAMSDLGFGRELGEGVNRMFEEMRLVGLPDPIYSQGPASVTVTLLADALVARVLDRLPRGSERFAEYLSRHGRVTTTEAVDLMQASRPTVLRHLHDLSAEGLLEHVGTSLKDPRGYWRLVRGA
ncbi:MAG: ATP-binding protein, partial [Thermoanaerobaculia bacterium]